MACNVKALFSSEKLEASSARTSLSVLQQPRPRRLPIIAQRAARQKGNMTRIASLVPFIASQLLLAVAPTGASFVTHLHTTKTSSLPHAGKEQWRTQLKCAECDSDCDSDSVGQYNVLGTPLKSCCSNVGDSGIAAGFWRNGYCSTSSVDKGVHTVCVECDEDFIAFSRLVNNDLQTPNPEKRFPGLKPGDRWCVCADRWVQAYKVGMAPKLYLESCHEKTLSHVSLDVLMKYAVDGRSSAIILERLNGQRSGLEKLFELDEEYIFG